MQFAQIGAQNCQLAKVAYEAEIAAAVEAKAAAMKARPSVLQLLAAIVRQVEHAREKLATKIESSSRAFSSTRKAIADEIVIA